MSNDLQPITQQLDMLIKLVASSFLSGKKQQEKIELLSRVGMAPKKIAELIGTTPNTVRVALVAIKKSNKKRGAQNGKVKKQSTS
jgi:DNA-binding CsgD family transcriptional regulator